MVSQVKTPAPPGGQAAEHGEFLHAPGRLFTDFEKIRTEIQAETERVAGPHKKVDRTPIRLKICSPHVL